MLGFRVWDSNNECFIKNRDYLIDEQGQLLEFDGSNFLTRFDPEDGLIAMQSTGLTDSKDVLIYEGDILLFNLWGTSHTQNMVVENVVEFIQYEYICAEHQGVESFKIIGNRYENPELLERAL